MAYRYTDPNTRAVYSKATGVFNQAGKIVKFWADAAGTAPIDVGLWSANTPDIPGASTGSNLLTVQADSMWPAMWDRGGVMDHMWIQAGTVADPGDLYLIYCDADQRADELAVRVTALEGGGGGAVSSVNAKTGVVVLNADDLADGTTNKMLLATERTKLTGIAAGATANSPDAALIARANHTGTQSADTLTDGSTNKAFLATERTKLAGVATGATANSTDAQLRDRSTHTGTESADVLTDGTTNKAFLATERTKLAGIATGATANLADLTILAKTANFTAVPQSFNLVDSTSGAVTATLPAANVASQVVAVKWDAGPNAPVIQRAGSDTIGSAGATSATMGLASEVWAFVSNGAGQWHLFSGNKSLSSLDGRYAQKSNNLSDLTSAATARINLGAKAPDVQTFTASGTWTMPAGAVSVHAIAIGGAGGGGSGRRGAAGTVRCGGGGGGAGGVSWGTFAAAGLPASVSVTVGSGGNGGAGQTADDTNGVTGGNGGASRFGELVITSAGSNGGVGGSATSGNGGGAQWGLISGPGGAQLGNGAAASTSGGAGTAVAAPVIAGGGCGGGITSGNTPNNGASGGFNANTPVTGVPAAAGVVDTSSAGNGVAQAVGVAFGGWSGGGGAGSITTAAGAGGSGGRYGAPGGGGGASLNGNTSGAGGAGGAGIVQVTTYF